MKLIFIISLTSAFSAFASVKTKPIDDVVRYRSQVMELGARLNSLEKEIGAKNNLYISSVEQIKQFESDIKLYKDKLSEVHAEVRKARLENKKILQSYLVESENDETEAWQRKAHFELLHQAQKRLKNKEEELVSFENKVADFDTKLISLKRDEEELAEVISELESRRKLAMESYLSKVKNKKTAETKVQKLKLQKKIVEVKETFSDNSIILKKPDRLFKVPVQDFKTFTSSAKGVTFKYQAVQPIKAVGAGKVVFAGDLASYGQVVLIDHGNDLRTVLLGKMDIKVRKNETVSTGDVLAYTQNTSKEDQNLYFEVRKKNTAQNTILWLDQNGVSKI